MTDKRRYFKQQIPHVDFPLDMLDKHQELMKPFTRTLDILEQTVLETARLGSKLIRSAELMENMSEEERLALQAGMIGYISMRLIHPSITMIAHMSQPEMVIMMLPRLLEAWVHESVDHGLCGARDDKPFSASLLVNNELVIRDGDTVSFNKLALAEGVFAMLGKLTKAGSPTQRDATRQQLFDILGLDPDKQVSPDEKERKDGRTA